jgi:hypothetical protein
LATMELISVDPRKTPESGRLKVLLKTRYTSANSSLSVTMGTWAKSLLLEPQELTSVFTPFKTCLVPVFKLTTEAKTILIAMNRQDSSWTRSYPRRWEFFHWCQWQISLTRIPRHLIGSIVTSYLHSCCCQLVNWTSRPQKRLSRLTNQLLK